MPEEKTENRFVKFFERNRNVFLPFKYFVYLVGIIVIILFILDFTSQAFLKENSKEEEYRKYIQPYYYEPFLDFGMPQRDTRNPCKDASENPLLIYTFGGSTMWLYAENGEDIASYISELLCRKRIPVEVKNFGIPEYASTLEVIKLFLELRNGNVPDIVVFYDGANEIASGGYNFKTPLVFKYFTITMGYRRGIFPNLREYFSRHFGKANSPFLLEDDLLDGYFSKFQLRTDGLSGEELYEKIMEIYLNNVKIVRSMEKDWGFKSFFCWQPTLYDKVDSLSGEEGQVWSHPGEEYSVALNLFNQLKTSDPIITKFLNDNKHVRDLRKVFNDSPDTVFVDYCHILPEKNMIIAEKMVEDIVKYLEEDGYYEKK